MTALSMALATDKALALDKEFVSDMEPENSEEELADVTYEAPMKSQGTKPEPQFKHAIMALGRDVAILASDDPWRALESFTELLEQIGKVKYYRPKHPRPSQPRATKRNINKWIKGRAVRMGVA